MLEQLSVEHFADGLAPAAKHIAVSDIGTLAPGVPPPSDSLEYEPFLDMQGKCGSLNGVFIWMQQVYVQLVQPANAIAGGAACFSHAHYKAAKHALAHLLAHPDPLRLGGPGCVSLAAVPSPLPPFEGTSKNPCLYGCVDANLATPRAVEPQSVPTKSITGGVIMLAYGCLDGLAQRQHLASPDAHTSETVAAGTLTQKLMLYREQLHEIHIHQVHPSALFIDAQSVVFTANDDASVKRSVWTIRRALVVQEAVAHKHLIAIKISDTNNLADLMTKYIKFEKWRRIIDYLLNVSSPAKPLAIALKP